MSSANEDVSLLLAALDQAESALHQGDVDAARRLLTGLEPRLLVAGFQSHLPRFFRLAAECEWQAHDLDEAIRLIRKGLARLSKTDDEERRRLVGLGRRIIEEVERQGDPRSDCGASGEQHG